MSDESSSESDVDNLEEEPLVKSESGDIAVSGNTDKKPDPNQNVLINDIDNSKKRVESFGKTKLDDVKIRQTVLSYDPVIPDSPSDLVFLNRNSTTRSPARRNTDILDSAEVKDLSWAQRCLANGSSPEATCKDLKLSVCHLAAYFGDTGILNEILKLKPQLYKRSDMAGRTPIHFATWEGNLECIAILLGLKSGDLTPDRMGRKERKERDKERVTEIVIEEERLKILNSTHGEKIEVYKDLCDSSHSCSSVTKILEVVSIGCTPFHIACARMQRDSALALLACGADITKTDAVGRTPLDVCGLVIKEAGMIPQTKSSSFVRIIEGVIRYGKNRNVDRNLWLSNQNGTTPLHMAVLLDSKKATKLLLDIRAVPGLVDEDGQTPLHLAILLRRTDILKTIANSPIVRLENHIDKLNIDQYTPLQLAILEQWLDGVLILLEANASITIQSNSDKNTALHLAAQVGNLDIADKLIANLSGKQQWIDCKNALDETPLFVAIKNGNASCVRCFLHEGASYQIDLGGYTVLHKAIETPNGFVLGALLEVEKISSLLNIADMENGMTPLHWAALKDRPHYTQRLLDKGADKNVKTAHGYNPLHIAAKEGNSEVIKVLLNNDKDRLLVNSLDNKEWLPFYRAAYHCQRDSIELFLENGANLSEAVPMDSGKKNLIISIIKNNMPRSAEYLNSIFNKRVTVNKFSLDQPECEVTFDYSIIMPDENIDEISQMGTMSALFRTGTNFEIKKLILHPFIESYLYLKWNILRWFFFVILGFYLFYVLLLTDVIIHMHEETYQQLTSQLFLRIKQAILIGAIFIILFLEIPFIRLKRWKYFARLEGWIKLSSVIMASLIVLIDIIPYGHSVSRLVVAIALLFSWMEITILLSRFPEFGYYFQMFATVAVRVVKVFALFGCFVIVGFALIFWILMRSNSSFISPWDSLIKTVVMMTSEFDYGSMMEGDDKIDQVVVQLFFIIFLVCVPIVLMNLLLALAVSDVKDLEIEGKIERLIEQVEFLANLEVLAKNIFYRRIKFTKKWKVERKISVFPGRPFWDPENRFSRSIIESLCENLNTRKENEEKDSHIKELLNKLDESNKFIQKQEIINHKRHMELVNALKELSEIMKTVKSEERIRSLWQKILNK